jgi:hypothetical protein
MGLDMYLTRRVYVGSSVYNEPETEEKIEFSSYFGSFEVNKRDISSITLEFLYWRKANAIHNWFSEHLADGKIENGRDYWVDEEILVKLYDDLSKAILTTNDDLFKPTEGFFFGGTEKDEYYWSELKRTLAVLKPLVDELKKPHEEQSTLLQNSSFYYRPSW